VLGTVVAEAASVWSCKGVVKLIQQTMFFGITLGFLNTSGIC
jgi:hypothetical protein